MNSFQFLPGAVLLLCWTAGVKSGNVPINGTTATSSQSSLLSDTSNTATITSAPTSIPSGTSAPHSFTGTDPADIVEWCFSDYGSYLNASGTPSVYTSSETETDSHVIDGITTITTFSLTYTATTTLVATPYNPPPQCYTGCVIVADRVRLEYWPTPEVNGTIPPQPTITPAPVVTAVVDGMTLYSPSNYLVYTGLSALNCPLGGSPCTTIGQPVDNFTLAVGQFELMTENCFHEFDTFNYADFNTPIPWSIVSTQIGCTLITESHPGNEPDYDFTLMPNILFPQEIRTAANTNWASCSFIDAAYDPPSALSPVHQLTSAAPGTTANPPIPPPTTTATPTLPPAESQTSAPVETPDPPTPPTTIPDPPTPPTSTPDPPISPPPTTVNPDPPTSSVILDPPVPPASSAVLSPPTNSDPAPPVNSGTPVNPADPATSISPPPVVPPVQSPGQSQPGEGNTGLGSIIASVGGINPPNPTPASTITLPAQNTGVDVPPAPILTTIEGQPVSIAPGIATTIPGVVTSVGGVVTTLPDVTITGAPSLPPPITATIGGNTITIAPGGGSAIVGGQTVTAGGAAITVSSTVISLGPTAIVVGSSTVALATPTAGSNVTTISPSGPLQASSAHKIGLSRGWIYSLAFTTFLILVRI